MAEKKYETGLEEDYTQLICCKCQEHLVVGPVNLEYMGNGFPVDLPKCPKCGLVYIPETLAVGKMLYVEKSLEDK